MVTAASAVSGGRRPTAWAARFKRSHYVHSRRVAPVLLAPLVLAVTSSRQPPSAFAADVSSPRTAPVAVRCQELPHLSRSGALPNPSTVISSAALNAAASSGAAPVTVPEHCEVLGRINERIGADGQRYAIQFHMRLPSAWNGRLFFQGGGATNGTVGDAWGYLQGRQAKNALGLGYAVVSQDGGHDNQANNDPGRGGTLAFGFDPQARLDFGYNSYHEVTRAAKALLRAYYGKGPERSYYVGCSEGGREGMMMTQRFPDEYDGVLAVAPGFRLPKASLIGESWDLQAFAAVARSAGFLDRSGQPLLNKAFSDQDLLLVSNAVLTACDRLDGLQDGIIDDFPACGSEAVRPQLAALTCSAAKTEACLTKVQIEALQKVFGGARNARGELLYADWPWDAGIGDPVANSTFEGWRRWKLGTFEADTNDAINATMGAAAAAVLFSTPPKAPAADGGFLPHVLGLGFDTDAATIRATAHPYDESAWDFMMASSTDLSRFKERGGKLIVVHGVSDPVFSVNDIIGWWKDVDGGMGGRAADAVRLFAVPGMAHCGTGPSTDQFDAFSALVQWVEAGSAPERITATARATSPWPNRTRPLCPFPKQARYRGQGSIEDATNFVCR
jgi:feruloyl esterase